MTLPLTTKRAWMITVSVLAVFAPLVVIDALAADAEPVVLPADLELTLAEIPAGTTTTEFAGDDSATSSSSAPDTTAAPETTTTAAPETTTTEAPTTTTTEAPTTTTTEAPTTTTTEAPPTTEAPSAGSSIWHTIAQCETGGDWSLQVRSFGGGLMIHQATWEAMGGTQYAAIPSQASMSQQIAVAEKIRAATGGGYSAWPGCQRKLGLP